jgi:F-type H+-transporting ATPase subunit a
MRRAASAIALGPESDGNERYLTKGHFGNLIEVVVLYLRDKVIRPQLGHDANKFTPLLLTCFFFILFNNLLGLVPIIDLQYIIGYLAFGSENYADAKVIGGTATGRLGVTIALALVVFVAWNVHGIKSNGFGGWAKHFLGGAPLYLAPLMVIVEVMGLIIKPAALAVRLFANMTAGHVLLATLILLPVMIYPALGPAALAGSIVSIPAAVAIFFLEIFVALLQAFIFMFLTTIFIGQMAHHEHDDHAGGEDYDYDHSAEDDRAVPVTA